MYTSTMGETKNITGENQVHKGITRKLELVGVT